MENISKSKSMVAAFISKLFATTLISVLLLVPLVFLTYLVYYSFFRYAGQIGEYTSLYFYSAIFQGNAALVTLSAMFVIYRKQFFDNKFFQLEKIIIDYLKTTANVTLSYGNIFDIENLPEAMMSDSDQTSKDKIIKLRESDAWKVRFNELRNYKEAGKSSGLRRQIR